MTAAGKKPAKGAKKTSKPDVDKPGKSAPSATSKPVIVTNRPILQDPMVVDEDAASKKETTSKEDLTHSSGSRVKPLEEPARADADTEKSQPIEDKQPEPDKQAEPENKTTDEKPGKEKTQPAGDETDDKDGAPAKPEPSKTAEQTKQAVGVQKLIDSKKYELPINAVEKRKTKRFMVLGILLAVLLTLAWIDIAADAGLIQIDGFKPVTHFFSN